jgi:ATP-binding protein involved in chromosome partitioning
MPVSGDGLGVVSLGALVPGERSLEFDSVAEGDSQVWRATREFTLLGQLLGCVRWGELDYLMIDLPPGAERTVQYAEFLGPETRFVLVTVPSAVSREVVARSLAALRRTSNRVLGYVENMDGYFCGACSEVRPLFPGADPLDLPCLGRVPFDPRLAAGAAPPDDPAGARHAVAEIASRIARALEEAR